MGFGQFTFPLSEVAVVTSYGDLPSVSTVPSGIGYYVSDLSYIATSAVDHWDFSKIPDRTWAEISSISPSKLAAGMTCCATDLGLRPFVWDGGEWIDQTDAQLRDDLNSSDVGYGASLVKTNDSLDLQSELDQRPRNFSNVNQMISATYLKVGDVVTWSEYYEGTGYGGNSGVVVAAGAGVADGGSYFQCTGTVYMIKAVHDKIFIDPKLFGAVPITTLGYASYDSTLCFNNALTYAKNSNISTVKFAGGYLIDTSTGYFETPGDDGTIYPSWVGVNGDTNIAAEPTYQIPYCINVPNGTELVAENDDTDYLAGSWNIASSNIDYNQKACLFITSGSKYAGSVKYKLKGFKITKYFIGRIVEGISADSYEELTITYCALPGIIQGYERKLEGAMRYNYCYTGDIVGGWWTHRNNTRQNPTYLPPYPATDIWAAGWIDAVDTDFLSYTGVINQPFGSRHIALDSFFNTYFFKSGNEVSISTGGRLSINSDTTTPIFTPYYGVVGRARTMLTRYGRGLANVRIKMTKILGCHRTPFWNDKGAAYYGNKIDNAYFERVGLINISTTTQTDNQFGVTNNDSYRSASYGVGYLCAHGYNLLTFTISSGCQYAATHDIRGAECAGSLVVSKVKGTGNNDTMDPYYEIMSTFDGTTYTLKYAKTDDYAFTQPLRFGSTSGPDFTYTEGTFTPALNINGTVYTVSSIYGGYKKVGKLVHFSIIFFSNGTPTFSAGDVTITGLPFTAATASVNQAGEIISVNQWNGLTSGLDVKGRIAGTTITLYKDSANTKMTGTDGNSTNAAGNLYIELGGWYMTA